MTEDIIIISFSASAVIIILLCLSPVLGRHFGPQKMYFVWLIIAVRLVIPFRFELPSAPVKITAPEHVIVMRTDGVLPIGIMPESERSYEAAYEPSPLNYAPLMTLSEFLTIIWALGASVFFTARIMSYLIFRIRIKPHLKDTYIQNVKICPVISSPLAAGFFRPVILLPEGTYTDEELELILMHEQAHIKRRDLWYKLLLTAANAVHWFNPTVYFMVRRANRDLEYSCDYTVTRDKDMDFRKKYSKTILKYTLREVEK